MLCCHRLFNLYTEHIMRNGRLDELQAGSKIGRRNIDIIRYENDTTLMAESKEKLKSTLMKVKEDNKKVGVQLNTKKMKTNKEKQPKIMASTHDCMANRRGNGGRKKRFPFCVLQNHCRQ